jgi:ssDNA-binding Zn-finger/Zn-ribbon topoisomerase 1
MKKLQDAGNCPKCGDTLILYKSSSNSRFIMCNDEECHFSYPIPRAGSIEITGAECPELELPVLFINKPASKSKYCWVKEPCFACRKCSSCGVYKDLKEEYDIKVPAYMEKKKPTSEEVAED